MWTFNKSFKTSENCSIIESCSGTDGMLQHGQPLLYGGKLLRRHKNGGYFYIPEKTDCELHIKPLKKVQKL